MYQIVLLFKIFIALLTIFPIIITCKSKSKKKLKAKKSVPNTATPKTSGTARNEDTSVPPKTVTDDPTVKTKPTSKIEKLEEKKPEIRRHRSDISINTGFEIDKGNKSPSSSVIV
ncbi:hypothetical protein GCK72_019216 [Caenorhabditis remanei]|uniref:Uncharacterized protein n=1 Tax=Caenorhabditis remanei TaxID=31234 RepID=A0A6A5GD60_CAERE|nr:hypothetical protein GCK72_019216 [Caenorhabditis remanei]KAF1752661.1 hypothetical protein GCK72_019216 [Caenorhabditis remanei]